MAGFLSFCACGGLVVLCKKVVPMLWELCLRGSNKLVDPAMTRQYLKKNKTHWIYAMINVTRGSEGAAASESAINGCNSSEERKGSHLKIVKSARGSGKAHG
ncbi:hypothetical protein BD769DRAFT_1387801 [Suillus cothurnatus]|nr:hypothetical protein BD769DRAFT_1387801 [Suillus cothurnatus]